MGWSLFARTRKLLKVFSFLQEKVKEDAYLHDNVRMESKDAVITHPQMTMSVLITFPATMITRVQRM